MWIIDFARYRVEWLYSLLVRLGGSLEESLLPRLQEAQQFLAILDRDDYFNCTSYAPPVIKTGIRRRHVIISRMSPHQHEIEV